MQIPPAVALRAAAELALECRLQQEMIDDLVAKLAASQKENEALVRQLQDARGETPAGEPQPGAGDDGAGPVETGP